MSSYDRQYNCGTPSQNYSLDQYDGSNDSTSSGSPQTRLSCSSSHQQRDDFPTPTSTDASNEADESCSQFNYSYNPNDLSKYLKPSDGLSTIVFNGNPLNQYFNSTDNSINFNGENLFQSYSVANFDPNFVPNSYSNSQRKIESDNSAIQPKTNVKNESLDTKSSFIMQPPESIDEATENAKRRPRPQRRSRTKFEKKQLDTLESTFANTHYPDVNLIDRLSRLTNLTTERISVWFQNRRARFKRSKKGAKEEIFAPNHNPILDEFGDLSNDSDNLKKQTKNFDKLDEEKSEKNSNSFNENLTDDENSKIETVKNSESHKTVQSKPIFNPMKLPHSSSNQNLSQNFYQQMSNSYYAQNNNQHLLKLPVNTVQDDEHNSSNNSAQSSRNSSPKPSSDSSDSSPDHKSDQESNFHTFHSDNQVYGQPAALPPHLFHLAPYQTGFNNNFYMPPIQPYAQNLPNIFQPYIEYNKNDASNGAYFPGFNPHTMPAYYGNA
ncbi:unnamed protein product [Brachionus calyciflorus]|uniref:Homeobox domain-containing protein n=2 Tax=Brachionus calyciflorus TaxID=104777 RepID=A0A814A8E0_9BILA|nr:unnamed protein product [Brachionus calyciflorus]